MSYFDNSRARFAIRSVILVTASFGLAACSSSVDRFGSYPPVNTASLPNKAPTTGVVRTPLSGTSAQTSKRPSWQQPANSYKAKTAYKAPAAYTAPVARTASYSPSSNGMITVQSGQTMYSLAKANGLSVSQLAGANGISYPYGLKVGQRLKVPGVSAPSSPAPSFTPKQPKYQAVSAPVPAKRNFASGGTHKVKPGETLFSLGRAYNQNPYAIAKHNNLQAPYGLNVGQVVKIPGASAGTTMAKAPTAAPFKRKKIRIATKNTDRIQPAPVPQVTTTPVIKSAPTRTAPTVATNSTFRWPVKGRVISSFGKKPGGLRNEGINIAVPEGTSVRSAESGIVAYAGNELKGYGNLVLIRHKNGWVTAYAHNKQLFVKRGDTVKRGTVIAKAGQTGSVTTPQLHFEVRKGASAVNPMKYLTSKTAALN